MSDENNKPEDELDEDQVEDELNESEDDIEDESEDEGIDLSGLTGAALTAAIAANKKRAARPKKAVKKAGEWSRHCGNA